MNNENVQIQGELKANAMAIMASIAEGQHKTTDYCVITCCKPGTEIPMGYLIAISLKSPKPIVDDAIALLETMQRYEE